MNENAGYLALHCLLDSYERRRDPAARAISVGVNCIPGYGDHVDPAIRLTANEFLRSVEARGWVELRWEKGEMGNIIQRITLQVAAVPDIYVFLARKPTVDRKREMEELVSEYQPLVGANYGRVLSDTIDSLRAGRSIAPFSLDDHQRTEDLLRALAGLNSMDGELPERDFSARMLGNSKRLASLKGPLYTLICRAQPDLTYLRPEDAWAAVGLLPNPGHVYLHGPLTFRLQGEIVRTDAFLPDLGLPVHAIPDLEIVDLRAQYLLTVENRTSFYDFVAAHPIDGLVLFLGGFPNQARRQILAKVLAFAPELPFYHWGDLDYGGLAILAYLRRSLAHDIRPHFNGCQHPEPEFKFVAASDQERPTQPATPGT